MPENQNTRLNYFKIEGDVRVPVYTEALKAAIEDFSINDEAFRNSKEEVLKGAVRLLSGYDVDPLFTGDNERCLFALAISDAWLSTVSIREKKSLLDVFKLVSTGEKEDEEYGTLSGKVRALSQHGILRGTIFNPEILAGNIHSEYISMLLKYVRDNTEEKATQEVSEILADWGGNCKLRDVRTKLGIISKENERPFRVVVLNKTAAQMENEVGYASLYISISKTGEFTVVFNREYLRYDSLEHEYAHSQSDGLSRWYQHLLFSGINEALTESCKSDPNTYPEQRRFLNKILHDHPEYEKPLYEAYVGNKELRMQIFSKIVNDYGLEGFLIFARVAPIDNPKMSGSVGESIFIEPNKALRELKKLASRSAKKMNI